MTVVLIGFAVLVVVLVPLLTRDVVRDRRRKREKLKRGAVLEGGGGSHLSHRD